MVITAVVIVHPMQTKPFAIINWCQLLPSWTQQLLLVGLLIHTALDCCIVWWSHIHAEVFILWLCVIILWLLWTSKPVKIISTWIHSTSISVFITWWIRVMSLADREIRLPNSNCWALKAYCSYPYSVHYRTCLIILIIIFLLLVEEFWYWFQNKWWKAQ